MVPESGSRLRGDARARLNLAYCAARDAHLGEALVWIARALAIDCGGGLTSEILERQSEIIGRLGVEANKV
jgi:hypothetical protein